MATALQLYTMGSAQLNHEADHLGAISPGKLADLAAYPADPFTADTDVLAALGPVFTIVGGRPVHDPHGLLGGGGREMMRIEASAACWSWIPPTAVEGAFRLPFGIGIAHYDKPPDSAQSPAGPAHA